jgi:hypothetical protein
VNHELNGDKVTYTIMVSDSKNGCSRSVRYRYSQLKDLHQELSDIVNKLQLHIVLPEFPGRKLFGATNKNEDAIL